jgi:hypothetical protein
MPDHAVLVYVKQLPGEDMALVDIEDPLIEAIEQAEVGEFDGNGIGPDGAELYMYGPDGEALWAIVEPVLRTAALAPGSYAVIRFGEPGARQRRVVLA